jgi:hypothetical protein
MRYHKLLSPFLLLGVLRMVGGCNASLLQGERGSIALMPFWNEEMGIQGVGPLQNWAEQAELVQISFRGTLDDLIPIVQEQTSITQLPEPSTTYRGKALTWSLWSTETQLKEAGPGTWHIELALAEGESAAYLVALVVQPEEYDANPGLYDTVFVHALYALQPLE